MLVINPKRINEEIEFKPFWYNYYAGYSHTFTHKIICSSGLSEGSIILDPWNGAGTTTLVSSINGYKSIGVDLNPVMKVIAKAKQSTKVDIPEVKMIFSRIEQENCFFGQEKDYLNVWFTQSSVNSIRNIESSILGGVEYKSTIEKIDSLSSAQCIMYTALFNCLRKYLSGFIPSNPTWIKKPKIDSDKIDICWSEFKMKYSLELNEMMNGLSIANHDWPENMAHINVGSSSNLKVEDSSIDFVLTSPPYCTRIDYGVATLPELSILCVKGEPELDAIRRSLMGTTTVPKDIKGKERDLGTVCLDFLEKVKSHKSKASSTYYYKNLVQYFFDLKLSINEIARVLKKKSKFICVVQDSYYKDLHCDLSSIVIEMAGMKNLLICESVEFESKNNMANLNTKAKKYRKKSKAFENVLIFEKS